MAANVNLGGIDSLILVFSLVMSSFTSENISSKFSEGIRKYILPLRVTQKALQMHFFLSHFLLLVSAFGRTDGSFLSIFNELLL